MNSSLYQYAFGDESGTVGNTKGTKFLVVAITSTTQPRAIQLPVRRTLKKYGRLSGGELKASNLEKAATERMLKELAKQDISIVAVVVDQKAITQPPSDDEDIYRKAAARAAYLLVRHFPAAHIILDQRYTKEHLRDELEKYIREEIRDLPHNVVLIRQESSYQVKELQAADAIAWALFQKYERGDSHFYDVISPKIIEEEIIVHKDWSNH